MTPAINQDQQGAAQRRGGQPLRRWSAAPSVVDHQSNRRVSSSLPATRCEKPRVNSGVLTRPGFFFTPRVTTLDEIHELRICELTGRQAVISSRVLQSFPDQAGGQAAVGPEFQDHHLSSSVASDVKHHDASRGRKVGKAFQYGA